MSDVEIRALQPGDAGATRVLVSAQLSGTRYEWRILEQLAIAVAGEDPECRGLVAVGPGLRGLALFGDVAGAVGVVKIHALIGDDRALQALASAVNDMGARMIVCEIADDAPFHVTAKALRELGYEEEGRVADFVRDGVDLLILTWRSR